MNSTEFTAAVTQVTGRTPDRPFTGCPQWTLPLPHGGQAVLVYDDMPPGLIAIQLSGLPDEHWPKDAGTFSGRWDIGSQHFPDMIAELECRLAVLGYAPPSRIDTGITPTRTYTMGNGVGNPAVTEATPPAAGLTVGDYMLATKFDDGGPQDHWAVGFYTGPRSATDPRLMIVNGEGQKFRANGFRRAQKVSQTIGAYLVGNARQIEAGARTLWETVALLEAVTPGDPLPEFAQLGSPVSPPQEPFIRFTGPSGRPVSHRDEGCTVTLSPPPDTPIPGAGGPVTYAGDLGTVTTHSRDTGLAARIAAALLTPAYSRKCERLQVMAQQPDGTERGMGGYCEASIVAVVQRELDAAGIPLFTVTPDDKSARPIVVTAPVEEFHRWRKEALARIEAALMQGTPLWGEGPPGLTAGERHAERETRKQIEP